MVLRVPFLDSPIPPDPTLTITSPQFRVRAFGAGFNVTVGKVYSATTQIGRTSSRTDGAAAGQASLHVEDTDRLLDPDNIDGALYGKLSPGGATTLTLECGVPGYGYIPLYTGLIESVDTTYPGARRSEATINLVDAQRDLRTHIPAASLNDVDGNPIPTYGWQQTGARISQLLGATSRSGWGWVNRAPTGAFAIDPGQKVLGPLVLDGSTSTWDYVAQAAAAEEGLAFFNQAGVPTFHDQARRPRETVAAWIFGDLDGEMMVDESLTYHLGNDKLIADVAYQTADGVTSVYGPGGASTMTTGGTAIPLADQYGGAARARSEWRRFSVNRRNAPTVTVNAYGEWPTVPADPLLLGDDVLIGDDVFLGPSPSRFWCALAAQVSDLAHLNRRLPTGVPISQDYWIDAIAHNITALSWTTTFTLVYADAPNPGFQLGVDKLGVAKLLW